MTAPRVALAKRTILAERKYALLTEEDQKSAMDSLAASALAMVQTEKGTTAYRDAVHEASVAVVTLVGGPVHEDLLVLILTIAEKCTHHGRWDGEISGALEAMVKYGAVIEHDRKYSLPGVPV